MVDQISSTPAPATTPATRAIYVQANGGQIKDVGDNLGVVIGTELTKGNSHLEAEAGVGTNYTAKLEAGHTFDIGKNMGLDLSLNTQGAIAANKTRVSMTTNVEIPEREEPISAHFDDKYRRMSFRGGAKAQLQFQPSKNFTLKVGGEAGYKKSDGYRAEQNTVLDLSTGEHIEMTQNYKHEAKDGWYATPTVDAELKAGKHLSFTGNADAYQGNIGVRYTF
jgi:hypothetical protein